MKHTVKYILFAAACAVLSISSCQKESKITPADALFRPIVQSPEYGGQWIELNWEKYEGADYFELVITGKDGLSSTVQTDTTFYRFEGLNYDTSYDIIVRSVSRSTGLTSRYYIVPTVTTEDFPTKLKSVSAVDNMANITWSGDSYTKLVCTTYTLDEDGSRIEGQSKEFEVSPDAEQATVEGLTAGSNYIVRAYNGEDYKGKKLFATANAEVYEGVVEDLRLIDAESAYSYFTQTYVNGIIEANPDQDITFILKGGTEYELATINFAATTGTIRIVTGLSLEGKATFRVSGNFSVASGASVGKISMEKVIFTDHPSKVGGASNFGGTYLFNFNQANSALGTLNLQNCDIRFKRGVLRSQTTATIDNIVIDGCTFDYIGGYGITNADNAAAATRNIKVSNSSFSHCEKMFVATKPTDKTMTFSAENCTFCWVPKGGNYFLDFNGMTVEPVLKNCIFGPAGHQGTAGDLNAFRGNGSLTVDNCYGTSDISWGMNATTGEPNSMMDLKSTGADVAGTFAAAEVSYTDITTVTSLPEMDFTLLSKDLKAEKVGDPRWY